MCVACRSTVKQGAQGEGHTSSQEQAKAKAQMLRRSGYDVSVWECTTAGAKLTNI